MPNRLERHDQADMCHDQPTAAIRGGQSVITGGCRARLVRLGVSQSSRSTSPVMVVPEKATRDLLRRVIGDLVDEYRRTRKSSSVIRESVSDRGSVVRGTGEWSPARGRHQPQEMVRDGARSPPPVPARGADPPGHLLLRRADRCAHGARPPELLGRLLRRTGRTARPDPGRGGPCDLLQLRRRRGLPPHPRRLGDRHSRGCARRARAGQRRGAEADSRRPRRRSHSGACSRARH
jgi:hypothetical protein